MLKCSFQILVGIPASRPNSLCWSRNVRDFARPLVLSSGFCVIENHPPLDTPVKLRTQECCRPGQIGWNPAEQPRYGTWGSYPGCCRVWERGWEVKATDQGVESRGALFTQKQRGSARSDGAEWRPRPGGRYHSLLRWIQGSRAR